MPLERSVSTSDLTRTLADEVAAYLEITDHLAEVRWFLGQHNIDVLDLGTTLDYAALHLNLAIGLAEKARLT